MLTSSIINVSKNIGIVLGTFSVLIGLMATMGVMPISATMAENMMTKKLKQEYVIIQKDVRKLENNYNNLSSQLGRIDERSKTGRETQKIILEELRYIRRNLK